MPYFYKEEEQQNKSMGYIYKLAPNESTDIVADVMRGRADYAFQYVARIDGENYEIEPEDIVEVFNQGGKVAASAAKNAQSCVITFFNPTTFRIAYMAVGTGSREDADDLACVVSDEDDLLPNEEPEEIIIPDDQIQKLDDSSSLDNNERQNTGEIDLNDIYGGYNSANEIDLNELEGFDQNINAILDDTNANTNAIGVGEWVLTLILMMIPIVNIVFLIVWLVSKKTNKTKKNFLKGYLVIMVIQLILSLIIALCITIMGVNILSLANIGDASNSNQPVMTENGNGDATSTSDTTDGSNDIEKIETDSLKFNKIEFGTNSDKEPIAIVTMTWTNSSSKDASPQDKLDVKAFQNNGALDKTFAEQDGYDPSKWTKKVSPSSAAKFQIAYNLKDETPFHIVITDRDTAQKIGETSEAVTE